MATLLMAAAEELCGGRLVACHEGGYAPYYVPWCALAVIETFAGVRTRARTRLSAISWAARPGAAAAPGRGHPQGGGSRERRSASLTRRPKRSREESRRCDWTSLTGTSPRAAPWYRREPPRRAARSRVARPAPPSRPWRPGRPGLRSRGPREDRSRREDRRPRCARSQRHRRSPPRRRCRAGLDPRVVADRDVVADQCAAAHVSLGRRPSSRSSPIVTPSSMTVPAPMIGLAPISAVGWMTTSGATRRLPSRRPRRRPDRRWGPSGSCRGRRRRRRRRCRRSRRSGVALREDPVARAVLLRAVPGHDRIASGIEGDGRRALVGPREAVDLESVPRGAPSLSKRRPKTPLSSPSCSPAPDHQSASIGADGDVGFAPGTETPPRTLTWNSSPSGAAAASKREQRRRPRTRSACRPARSRRRSRRAPARWLLRREGVVVAVDLERRTERIASAVVALADNTPCAAPHQDEVAGGIHRDRRVVARACRDRTPFDRPLRSKRSTTKRSRSHSRSRTTPPRRSRPSLFSPRSPK